MKGHRITFIVLTAIAFVACGSSDDANDVADPSAETSSETSTPPGSSRPADAETDTTPTPSIDETAGDGGDEIDSVQWGPDDPPIPDEYAAFAADSASGLRCDAIDARAGRDDFWTLALDICRVFTGEGDWPDTAAVPPRPREGNSYQRCLDEELSRVLEAALAWHAANLGEAPSVRYPSSGTRSPCQTSLYDVAVTSLDIDEGTGCTNDEPSEVPTPGIPVTVSAPGIIGFANPQATVDGADLCVISDSRDNALRTFVVVVPTSGDAHTVTIAVETNYGVLSAAVALPAINVEPTTVPTPESTEVGDATRPDQSTQPTTSGVTRAGP